MATGSPLSPLSVPSTPAQADESSTPGKYGQEVRAPSLLSSQSRITISLWEGQAASIFHSLQLQAEEAKCKFLVSVVRSGAPSHDPVYTHPVLALSQNQQPKNTGTLTTFTPAHSGNRFHLAEQEGWSSHCARHPENRLSLPSRGESQSLRKSSRALPKGTDFIWTVCKKGQA